MYKVKEYCTECYEDYQGRTIYNCLWIKKFETLDDAKEYIKNKKQSFTHKFIIMEFDGNKNNIVYNEFEGKKVVLR